MREYGIAFRMKMNELFQLDLKGHFRRLESSEEGKKPWPLQVRREPDKAKMKIKYGMHRYEWDMEGLQGN